MGSDVILLLPEIWLLVGALTVVFTGSFLPRRALGRTRTITVVALGGSGVTTIVQWAQYRGGGAPTSVFAGSYAYDTATLTARLITVCAAVAIVLANTAELRASVRQAELLSLILLASLGTIVLAGAHDLLIVITGFLLASIPLYALIGLTATARAAEAAMKTYFYGSLFGIVLMIGATILYGVGGATGFDQIGAGLAAAPTGPVIVGAVAVMGGLMFKSGGVPGHFWVPDAAQGGSSLAATFLTTVPRSARSSPRTGWSCSCRATPIPACSSPRSLCSA